MATCLVRIGRAGPEETKNYLSLAEKMYGTNAHPGSVSRIFVAKYHLVI